MKYFGPECSRKEGEEQVPAPVGQPCIWCDEPIGALDMGTIDNGGSITHYECLMRSVLGSSGHQLGNCFCCGGVGPGDPVGLTRRQAAVHAVAVWNRKQRSDA